jgi:hypothetical protein
MIQELSDRLLLQLEGDLERIAVQVKEPLGKMTAALREVEKALVKLKGFVREYAFRSEEEEIFFFKHTKPAYTRWQVYFTELYTIETHLPYSDAEKQVAYLEKELFFIDRVFQQYAFLYQYYKLGAEEMDRFYFKRGAEVQQVMMPQVPELDREFSTGGDFLFARFRALDLLKEWVLDKLLLLRNKGVDPAYLLSATEGGKMCWTGDTIDLAEVGLALYHTGKLNHGTAGVGEVFRWLGEVLRVNIGVPAKRFAEIKNRKRLSRTRYLDEMKDALNQKMDKDDAYVPTGRKG